MLGIIGIGDKVQIKDSDKWCDGILEKILFAIPECQTTFFVKLKGYRVSIPYRHGMELDIREG